MAFKLILFPLIVSLIAVNFIFAEEGSQSPFGSGADEDGEPQDRLFFGRTVSCNYTTEGGRTCSSCRQALACYPNNVGRVRTCRGLHRYCNNGRCTFIPGSLCTNSTG